MLGPMADRSHLQLTLTVDLAILTVREDLLHVLVMHRGRPVHRPYPTSIRSGTETTSRARGEATVSAVSRHRSRGLEYTALRGTASSLSARCVCDSETTKAGVQRYARLGAS